MFQSSVKWSSVINLVGSVLLKKIESECIINSYSPREKVFLEEKSPVGIYVVKSGLVKIYKTAENGNQHIFQICKNDDLIGFHPILSGTLYPDSAETLTTCELIFIPLATFNEILDRDEIARYLLKSMSIEFTKFINQEIYLTQKNVMQRTAIMLLELDKAFKTNDSSDCHIALSRLDLANICSTTKESLVRVLSEFRRQGVIESNGKTTKVLKPGILTRKGYY